MARTAPFSRNASSGRASGTSPLAKARARWSGGAFRRAKADRAREAAEMKRAEAAKPVRRRHVLPLPVRMLAMLCAFVLMVGFAVVLAKITLEPSPASVSLVHSNLRPGRSIRAYLDQPDLRDTVKQIGGNILLGVPFGILVPVLAPGARGIWRVLLLTATVMLLVEMAQGALVTGRAFDVDDVILNTSGALLGHLLVGRRLGRVHDRRAHDGRAHDGRAHDRRGSV
ncbi:VanZ family protein [Streptomyces murinus]